MPRIQIKKIGASAALPLSENIMELLGIRSRNEVDVIIENHKLIVCRLSEEERKKKVEKAVHKVFERRNSAYRRLAEGVREEQP